MFTLENNIKHSSLSFSLTNAPRINPDIEEKIRCVLKIMDPKNEIIEQRYDGEMDSFSFDTKERKIRVRVVFLSDACELSLKKLVAIDYQDYMESKDFYAKFIKQYNEEIKQSDLLERVHVLGPSVKDLKKIYGKIDENILSVKDVFERLTRMDEDLKLADRSITVKGIILSKIIRTLNRCLLDKKTDFYVSADRSNFLRLECDRIVDFSEIEVNSFENASEAIARGCENLRTFFENRDKVREMTKDLPKYKILY